MRAIFELSRVNEDALRLVFRAGGREQAVRPQLCPMLVDGRNCKRKFWSLRLTVFVLFPVCDIVARVPPLLIARANSRAVRHFVWARLFSRPLSDSALVSFTRAAHGERAATGFIRNA